MSNPVEELKHKRFPMLVTLLAAGNSKVTFSQLCFKPCVGQTKYPGDWHITRTDPQKTYVGRLVRSDCSYSGTDWATLIAVPLLLEIEKDPLAAAKSYARATNNCSFCGRELTDDRSGRSVELGYGPVCAAKYNLPWGEEPVSPASASVQTFAQMFDPERLEAARLAEQAEQAEQAAVQEVEQAVLQLSSQVAALQAETKELRALLNKLLSSGEDLHG